MRTLRPILILLLCFTLPAYGYAALGIIQPPCPMQSAGTDGNMSHANGDCCLDADTAAKTGKTCKTGQECKVGGMFQITLLQPVFLFASGAQLIPVAFLPCIASDPSGFWRPPRAL